MNDTLVRTECAAVREARAFLHSAALLPYFLRLPIAVRARACRASRKNLEVSGRGGRLAERPYPLLAHPFLRFAYPPAPEQKNVHGSAKIGFLGCLTPPLSSDRNEFTSATYEHEYLPNPVCMRQPNSFA